MSKLLQKLKVNHPNKVAGWYKNRDGYWIDLKKGWQWNDCHSVHEWTVKDALLAFYLARQCKCDECKGERK